MMLEAASADATRSFWTVALAAIVPLGDMTAEVEHVCVGRLRRVTIREAAHLGKPPLGVVVGVGVAATVRIELIAVGVGVPSVGTAGGKPLADGRVVVTLEGVGFPIAALATQALAGRSAKGFGIAPIDANNREIALFAAWGPLTTGGEARVVLATARRLEPRGVTVECSLVLSTRYLGFVDAKPLGQAHHFRAKATREFAGRAAVGPHPRLGFDGNDRLGAQQENNANDREAKPRKQRNQRELFHHQYTGEELRYGASSAIGKKRSTSFAGSASSLVLRKLTVATPATSRSL